MKLWNKAINGFPPETRNGACSQQLVLSAPFSFFSPLLPFAGLELHNCQPAGTIAAPGCQSTTHLGLLLKINQ
jgi:hypothetical protein